MVRLECTYQEPITHDIATWWLQLWGGRRREEKDRRKWGLTPSLPPSFPRPPCAGAVHPCARLHSWGSGPGFKGPLPQESPFSAGDVSP